MANIKKGDICPKVMLQRKKSGTDRQSFCEGINPRKYSTKLLKKAGYQKNISPQSHKGALQGMLRRK